MTRFIIAGLFVLGFSVASAWFGHDLMKSHHIRSTLNYGVTSSVEGSQLSIGKSEFHNVFVRLEEVDVGTRWGLRVELGGQDFKVAALELKQVDALGIPVKKVEEEKYKYVSRVINASNGTLAMRFGEDGYVETVAVRFHGGNIDPSGIIGLRNDRVILRGPVDRAQIEELLGKPKDRSHSLRIP